uniref:Uncharacterized protein n=1 Tax=uncultured Acetothermia bacterium TaxID=236499 RepID=H5SC89_9BACT|nr:hypothetical protein HGMM_F08F07C34 [uncultured Acetothermia bacterium]
MGALKSEARDEHVAAARKRQENRLAQLGDGVAHRAVLAISIGRFNNNDVGGIGLSRIGGEEFIGIAQISREEQSLWALAPFGHPELDKHCSKDVAGIAKLELDAPS